MSYGCKIKNTDSEIQIDDTYINYNIVETHLSESISNAAGDVFTTVSFTTATSLNPLILFRPTTDSDFAYISIDSYIKSGSNFTGFKAITTKGFSNNEFDWKLALPSPSKSAETYGLRTYNSSGDLIFDSGLDYFKIYSVTTGIDIKTAEQTVTHAGISNPYYILSPTYFAVDSPAGGIIWYRAGLKYNSSTSVKIREFQIKTGVYPPAELKGGNRPDLTLLVCDVN